MDIKNKESTLYQVMNRLEPFRAQGAIDLTVFMGQWPTRLQIQASAADLASMADTYGLKGMCVSHIASIFGFDTRSGNEELFRVSSADERIWPYAILNPAEAGWELELEWAVREGARGIRLVPGYHDYSLLSEPVTELVTHLSKLQLPLQICVRLEDERLAHPRFMAKTIPFHELAELLRLAGNTPVIMSGLRAREWNSVREHLNVDHSADHVLLDLWFTNGPVAAVAALCQSGYSQLMGYGSCAPIQTPEATAFQLATANISENERSMISHGNAARLLVDAKFATGGSER